MSTKGTELMRNLIRNYYRRAHQIHIDRVPQREFGIGTFDRKVEQRHMSFKSVAELEGYLTSNAPPYISHSTAYYEFPEGRPMDKKVWKGAELVFDLDATDMNLQCAIEHGRSWICTNCLESVKQETLRLIEEFLMPDFGVSGKEIRINFSGNRGYHVRISREDFVELDSDARKEISAYISGNDIDFSALFPTKNMAGVALIGPRFSDGGCGGRIARGFISTLNKGTEALVGLGMSPAIAKKLYDKRALIEMGIRNANWDMVYIKKKADFWKGIIASEAIRQGDKIDKNVTTDTSHLIRLVGSIHGETGLAAKQVPSVSALSAYDPMKECIAFAEGEIKIQVKRAPQLVIGDEVFGPFEEFYGTLPTYAAAYLYLKGKGDILE